MQYHDNVHIVCMYMCVYLYVSICLSVCLSVCASVRVSAFVHVWLYITIVWLYVFSKISGTKKNSRLTSVVPSETCHHTVQVISYARSLCR